MLMKPAAKPLAQRFTRQLLRKILRTWATGTLLRLLLYGKLRRDLVVQCQGICLIVLLFASLVQVSWVSSLVAFKFRYMPSLLL